MLYINTRRKRKRSDRWWYIVPAEVKFLVTYTYIMILTRLGTGGGFLIIDEYTTGSEKPNESDRSVLKSSFKVSI